LLLTQISRVGQGLVRELELKLELNYAADAYLCVGHDREP